MALIRPEFAHLPTVFGSTRNRSATSREVSRRSRDSMAAALPIVRRHAGRCEMTIVRVLDSLFSQCECASYGEGRPRSLCIQQ